MALLKSLWPYLMIHKARVIIAMALLVSAKGVALVIPWVFKHIVDALDGGSPEQLLVIPLGFVLLYGGMRFGAVFLGELRDAVFSRVTESAMSKVGLEVFAHLHQLELDFHLGRQTGGISRDIDRGTNGINFMMRFMVFNILPTIIELIVVMLILLFAFDVWFSAVTLVCVVAYVAFSIKTTEWRTRFVKEANRLDSKSSTRAVDSLLNFETVKYFNNEAFEAKQYNTNLRAWEQARVDNRLSLALLNSGQALIIGLGVTALMYLAAKGVAEETMTIGDLVMVNLYLLQLFVPLNALGFIYREIRRALSDIENMFGLLRRQSTVQDKAQATVLKVEQAAIEFEAVDFSYQSQRQILKQLSFSVAPGEKVAIVGPSGSGKSTIGRLLFRFYDISAGAIRVDGQDVRDVQQLSLRQAIGVVPQDTVLFNDTIWNNVAYGFPEASDEAIWKAIDMASLRGFVESIPDGVATVVGERGLKVSGGEKQRIAIARVLLKNPAILLFDEATSALDSESERSILKAMVDISANKTTLVIAHRLSTVVDADRILVVDGGEIVEQGSHQELLTQDGQYARLWHMQQTTNG
ncbi:ABC transporter ATP-binding protein/permease [Oceanospirillaceae bacterium]|nr:ABC transporter ATP-binding protein/permease [Oceanospirillaceae bacterium]MBT4997569.1 ABC transporter ATP-binding protein/permease [Oceanospirillaceae bacterium]MBT5630074.1 ABC transporter ATP-binding protein/permease [Oceanospirillaceae bacterium]MBT6101608.1 ABC transporter ATP-binding protein/permease [Oceanospirillaceae bacterium]MBT7674380.1 ABC transporter ATP-binding protein/permease [Oceanospirillaceae bacterium]